MARFTWSEISQHVSFIRCHFSRAELELCTRTQFAYVFLNALHPGGPQLHVRISAVNHWCAAQQYGHVELEAFTLKCICGGLFVVLSCWRVFCFIILILLFIFILVDRQCWIQTLISCVSLFFYTRRERTWNGWAVWVMGIEKCCEPDSNSHILHMSLNVYSNILFVCVCVLFCTFLSFLLERGQEISC